MDGFAALGVAANIAQALEYGFKLLQKSKNLRELGAINPDLNDDAWRLNKIALSLRSQQLPNSHKDLQNLATECAEVSGDLISELEKLAPTNPKSKRQRAKAILKNELRRGHIYKLEKRLNGLTPQLNLHLTSIARIESNGKLDEIGQDVHKMTSELAALQFSIKRLRDSAHIDQEVSKTLQSLVGHYHDRFSQSSERAILDKLHFPDMLHRFDTIPDAHEESLLWLFEPPTNDHGPKEKARTDFIAWLEQGSGFFHVSGKPGAGKSTMMKYICSHQALDNHLKIWCQGAQLGCGQFFFWLPGTAQQKSLKGLLRGLLYSILDKNRDLIPTAFPDLWELMRTHSSSRELEYRDFQEGFANILEYASQSRLYKFALFIDGLDEFEGRHLELINTMKEWTAKFSTVLKICVSSREYMVFQDSFSCYPKLRLHECTAIDIKRMVSAHLRLKQQPVDLLTSDQSQVIIDLITTRAEGVFLWVSIVLASLEDSIINGASFRELKENIEAYPTELDPLYRYLVNLVRESDHRWVFRALKMVQFFQFHRQETLDVESWRLSLLQLSFLEDVQDDSASTLGPEAAAQRLSNTYKKVYGRCKGFLHVQASSQNTIPPTLKQEVVFIHRTIVEFLETPSFAEIAQPYIDGFDCFDNACQIFVKCVEFQRPIDIFLEERPQEECINKFWKDTIFSYSIVADKLRRITSRKFWSHWEAFRVNVLALFKGHEHEHVVSSLINQLIAISGLEFCVTEPLDRIRDSKSRSSHYPFSDSRDVLMAYKDLHSYLKQPFKEVTFEKIMTVLDAFLSLGLNLTSFQPEGNIFWRSIILDFMDGNFPEDWYPAEMIDWYLRHGADPDLIVGQFIPHGLYSLQWPDLKGEWELFWPHLDVCSSLDIASYNIVPGQQVFMTNETTHFCQYIRKNGGILKLRDLLSYWFPDNEYFPNLIHALQSARDEGGSDPTPLPNETEMPHRQAITRTWKGDYNVYSMKDFRRFAWKSGLKLEELDNQLSLLTWLRRGMRVPSLYYYS